MSILIFLKSIQICLSNLHFFKRLVLPVTQILLILFKVNILDLVSIEKSKTEFLKLFVKIEKLIWINAMYIANWMSVAVADMCHVFVLWTAAG